VAEYPISRGVDPQHLSAIGYGESRPVIAGGRKDNQANRRIEIRVARMSLGSGATVASARQTGGVGLRQARCRPVEALPCPVRRNGSWRNLRPPGLSFTGSAADAAAA